MFCRNLSGLKAGYCSFEFPDPRRHRSLKLVLQSLIVVVDGNRKNFFSLCRLSNHVLVKVLANFPWSRDLLIQNRFAYCCSSRCLRIFCRRRRRSGRQTGLLHCFGNNAGVFSQLASAVFAKYSCPLRWICKSPRTALSWLRKRSTLDLCFQTSLSHPGITP